MSDARTVTTSLVGAHFRPPAKALLACLPSGHPLFLRPEPTNDYDPNAVQVVLRTSTLPTDEAFSDATEPELAGQGYDLDTVRSADEWQLGYIQKTAKGNPQLEAWNIQLQEALHQICGDSGTVACSLSFDSQGKPTVVIPWPPTLEAPLDDDLNEDEDDDLDDTEDDE